MSKIFMINYPWIANMSNINDELSNKKLRNRLRHK